MSSAYYNFISYIREGFSNTITEQDILGIPDTGSPLVQYTARIYLNGDENTPKHNLPIMLAGPGEITGIDEKVIVKKAPLAGDTNFSPTFVPFIEFYSPDFPWRYTAAAPAPAEENGTHAKRLRPWLTLVTLEEEEFTLLEPAAEGLPSRFKLNNAGNLSKLIPSEQEIWAWAHIQVNSDITDDGLSETTNIINDYADLIQDSPDKVISRIISPRKLKLNKNYRAFLIPTFKRGIQAALGQEVLAGKQEPGWYHNPVSPNTNPDYFPYYYSWGFSTGEYGDFESLARKITPSVPSPDMGKMKMDMTRPNHGWLDNIVIESQEDWDGHLDMEGVLKQPLPLTPELPIEIETVYTDLVNLGDDFQNTASGTITDPTLTIPFYGQWYAGVSRLDELNNRPWLNLMNKDPRFRLMVGAGQEVIRNNSQSYLDKAWGQAGGKAGGGASTSLGGGIGSGTAFRSGGGLQQSNKTLRKLQTAYLVADRFFKKHTQQLPDDEFLSVFGRVLNRIKHNCGCTGTYDPPFEYIPNPLPPMVPTVQFVTTSFTPIVTGGSANIDWQFNQGAPTNPYMLKVQQTHLGATIVHDIYMPGTPTHIVTLTYAVLSSTEMVTMQILPSAPYLIGENVIATAEIPGSDEGGGGETPTVEFSFLTFNPVSSGPSANVDWIFTQDTPSLPYTLNVEQTYMGQVTGFTIDMPGSTPYTHPIIYDAGSMPEIVTLMILPGSGYNIGNISAAEAVIPPYNVVGEGGGGIGGGEGESFNVQMTTERSIKACVKCSSASVKIIDPAFRSLTRRGSTIMRVMGFHKNNPHNTITQVGNGTVKTVPPYTYPGSQLSVSYGIMMTYPISDTDFVLTHMEYSSGNYDWNAYPYDPNSNFRITAKVMNDMLNAVNETISLYDTEYTPDPLDVIDLAITAKEALQPYKNLKALADARIKVNGDQPISQAVEDFEFNPVKTAPVFDMPMIKPLIEFYDEFFCPNISEIADNSMTLMEVNRPFIEAYMVGINHELNRRLLWDEYPTDQRTTFFRSFFESSMYPPRPGEYLTGAESNKRRDITDIHTWEDKELGENNPRLPADDASIVLVLRAELLRKFPNLDLYAQEAEWKTVGDKKYRVLKEDTVENPVKPKRPIFFADAKPDVKMFGFALTRQQVEGSADPEDNEPGYFFVFQERGGEVRFGFSIPTDESEFSNEPENWEDLNWGHIAGSLEAIDEMTYIPIEQANWLPGNNIPVGLPIEDGPSSNPDLFWGNNSADMAYILYDKPVKLSFHASTMLANV
ncbi:MAG: hypothetical protein F9K23_08455 [Bacteroidetes bacterium]|nr:MAG: hypothetical protein F9K23_08455 [Bacteroidota bacterium]